MLLPVYIIRLERWNSLKFLKLEKWICYNDIKSSENEQETGQLG